MLEAIIQIIAFVYFIILKLKPAYANKFGQPSRNVQVLKTYSLPKLSQEETGNLNPQITRNELESVKTKQNKSSCKQKSRTRRPHSAFLPNIYKRTYTFFSNYSKKLKKKKHSQIHSMRQADNRDIKTRQRHYKKYFRSMFLMTMYAKIFNKILANQVQQFIKMIIHHDQVGFITGSQ